MAKILQDQYALDWTTTNRENLDTLEENSHQDIIKLVDLKFTI